MINATPVRPLTSASPSGLPTPNASTPVPPSNTPPTPPPSSVGLKPVPKKRFSMKMILGLLVFLVVAVGAAAGFYLTQMNQDTRQQAYEPTETCNETGGQCITGAGCPSGSTSTGGRCGSGQTCCRTVVATITCPAGSTPITTTSCRCNVSGTVVGAGGNCMAGNCPSASLPVDSGADIGKCRCLTGGSIIFPNESCAAPMNPCTDLPGHSCKSSCGAGFEGVGGRSCGPNTVCCKPTAPAASCPAGSTPVYAGSCRCDSTGLIVPTSAPGQASPCPAPTACNSYKEKNLCEQFSDSFTCKWENGECRKLIGCPPGASQVSGAPAGTCTCSTTGTIIPPGSTATCPAVTGCSSYKSTALCQQNTDSLSCEWENGACKAAATGGAPKCGDMTSQLGCHTGPVANCTWSQSNNICITRGNINDCTTIFNPAQCGYTTDNLNCTWNSTTNKCLFAGTGGNNQGTCSIAAGQPCSPGATACCANGGVCQGVAGKEVCQVPTTSPDAQCGTGGTCTGWYGFKCTQLMTNADGNPECLENGAFFTTRAAAINHAGSCGQVDQVCVGGTIPNQLCGDFTVFTQSCVGTPNPSPSSPIGPMCMSVTVTVNGEAWEKKTPITKGSTLRLTCGKVAGVDFYRFRITEPDGNRVGLTDSGNRKSEPYVVQKLGNYKAQCRVCTGPNVSSCQPWETIN